MQAVLGTKETTSHNEGYLHTRPSIVEASMPTASMHTDRVDQIDLRHTLITTLTPKPRASRMQQARHVRVTRPMMA